jgi:fucose permease
MLQGLLLVSVPASAAVLRGPLGLSNAEYGAVFLPQVALAVFGSIAGGNLARKLGLKAILVSALVAGLLSQLALAASAVVPAGSSYASVLVSTSLLGLSFGLAGAPLNAYPPLLFPERKDTALIALHSLLGLGLAVGPLVAAPFIAADTWIGFPALLAGVSLVAVGAALIVPLPVDRPSGDGSLGGRLPTSDPLFWVFVAIAVLYAFAEGTFANWAVVYLNEGVGVEAGTAALGLSVFWGALVAGRILISILVSRVDAVVFWLALPILMIATFLLLPTVTGAASGIALFGLAGFAASAFFPLTITLASRAFPDHVAWVSAMMTAALMAGVGLGSFVFGPLREWLSFGELYRLSAAYPLLVLILAFLATRSSRCEGGAAPMCTGSRCR